MTSDVFVGEGRKALVDGLVGVFEEVRDSGRPRWVSLEAPSGWGKTRIGRELYARLAGLQQNEAPYWPAAIEDPDRKAVEPREFERPASASPEYLWWGISCSARRELGRPSALLGDDVWRLSRHGTYMNEQVKRLGTSPVRAQSVVGKLAARSVPRSTLSKVATELTAWDVARTVGALVDLARWGTQKTAERRELRREIVSPTMFRGSYGPESNIVDETVQTLGRVTRAGFPVVMLLEDVHDADGFLLELLDKLMRCGGSLMVVTTAWPERVGDVGGEFSLPVLMEFHVGMLRRVGHTEAAGEGFPEGAGLMMLEADARQQILRGFFPDVEAATERALVERYESPLALRLFCQWFSDACRPEDRNADGALELSQDAVGRLPRRIRDLYQKIWQELPVEVQISLAVARLITPASINATGDNSDADGGSDEDTWTAWVLSDVLDNLSYDRFAEVPIVGIRDALESGTGAHSWVRIVGEHLCSFTETLQKDIAEENGHNLLASRLELGRDNARSQILTQLARTLVSGTESLATSNAARCTLALHANGYITDIAVAARAILALLDDLADTPLEFDERFQLYEQFLDLGATVPNNIALAIHNLVARAYGEAGQIYDAVDICERALSTHQQALEPGHPDAFAIRSTLASLRGMLGTFHRRHRETAKAAAEFGVLVGDLGRVLGDDHPSTLVARSALAFFLRLSGQAEEAAAAFGLLLEELELWDLGRVLGDDHSGALATGSDLDTILRLSGQAGEFQAGEFVTGFGVLVGDLRRVLGDDHLGTLRARSGLAICRALVGTMAEFVAEFGVLVGDLGRALGDDHLGTLAARSALAFFHDVLRHDLGSLWRHDSSGIEDDIAAERTAERNLLTHNYLAFCLEERVFAQSLGRTARGVGRSCG